MESLTRLFVILFVKGCLQSGCLSSLSFSLPVSFLCFCEGPHSTLILFVPDGPPSSVSFADNSFLFFRNDRLNASASRMHASLKCVTTHCWHTEKLCGAKKLQNTASRFGNCRLFTKSFWGCHRSTEADSPRSGANQQPHARRTDHHVTGQTNRC